MYCCVPQCPTGEKLYNFPGKGYEKELRERWIAALNLTNSDGTPWRPGPRTKICNRHFIGGKKSNIHSHPSSVPSLFLGKKNISDQEAKRKLDRFDRFMKRRAAARPESPTQEYCNLQDPNKPAKVKLKVPVTIESDGFRATEPVEIEIFRVPPAQYKNIGVQVFTGWINVDFSFYVSRESLCEVGTQCNVSIDCPFKYKRRKKIDVACGPDHPKSDLDVSD